MHYHAEQKSGTHSMVSVSPKVDHAFSLNRRNALNMTINPLKVTGCLLYTSDAADE